MLQTSCTVSAHVRSALAVRSSSVKKCSLIKMAPDLCGKITLCFTKATVILIFCTSIGIHKKKLLVYQQISVTMYILTVGTSSLFRDQASQLS